MAKEILLTQGKIALVDEDDYENVAKYKWAAARIDNVYYAIRGIRTGCKTTTQLMHGFITGYTLTDHINNNGLDNRRENLRSATPRENARNRRKQQGSCSVFKGVTWNKEKQKWQAQIFLNGRNKYLGRFESEIDAAAAYDLAALKYFGEFACTNEILGLLERKL